MFKMLVNTSPSHVVSILKVVDTLGLCYRLSFTTDNIFFIQYIDESSLCVSTEVYVEVVNCLYEMQYKLREVGDFKVVSKYCNVPF